MNGSRGFGGSSTSRASWSSFLPLLVAVCTVPLAGCSDREQPEQGSSTPAVHAALETAGSGEISFEEWDGTFRSPGAIPVDTEADRTGTYTSFASPVNVGHRFGRRVHGILTAPTTGDYTFWISADDNGELWLSSSVSPADRLLIASLTRRSSPLEWNRYSTQKSQPVALVAGGRYYIEALQPETLGGDHVEVGWAKPGQGTTEPSEVIPGTQLSPWVPCTPTAVDDATCDGVDDDCDGEMDEDYMGVDCDTGQAGVCAQGTTACADGAPDCVQNVQPTADDPTCDGIDEDCDGQADEDYVGDPISCGTGACLVETTSTCVDGVVDDGCTPGNAAPDDVTCDGVDDDCNGAADEDYVPGTSSCGTGACAATGTTACVDGSVQDSCSPGDPAADDTTCDAIDDDCDGTADEDFASQPTSCGVGACASTGSTSCVDGDVEDSCAAGAPAAEDATCDGVDDDCDGSNDEDYVSVNTNCGVGACAATGNTACVAGAVVDSCTPGDPAADDATCDGIDDDCDGLTDEDYVPVATSCGVGACAATGELTCVGGSTVDSCAPGDAAADDSLCNGGDDDCDGEVDEDFSSQPTTCGTGPCASTGTTSCVDGAEQDSCTPGTPAADDATCDGIDDDCDGTADEDFASQPTSCGVGACASTGSTSCVDGDVEDSCAAGAPADDDATCDGVDDDCDGSTDENYVSENTTCGLGECAATGITSCESGSVVDSCTPGEQQPELGSCNGIDEDCDGSVDEEYVSVSTTCGTGACASTGSTSCVAGAVVDSCAPGDAAADDATCDGVDDDCDGLTDEDYMPGTSSCGEGVCAATGTTACVAGTEEDVCTPGTPSAEICDGLDNDCNGVADYPNELVDGDDDGSPLCLDCDDDDPALQANCPETLTFQQGQDGYSGTADTWIQQSNPNPQTSNALDSSLDIDQSDGGGENQGLIRFDGIFGDDLGQIPTAAEIRSATLTFRVTDAGSAITVHQMLVSWLDTMTWATGLGGNGIQTDDLEATSAAVVTTSTISTGTLGLDVTATLESWIANPTENFGWALLSTSYNGVMFDSAEGSTPPMLQVEFVRASCTLDSECDDGDPCTLDVCNAGACGTNGSDNEGGPCDDGDACTDGETCQQGVCLGGTAISCDNGVFCDGVETCDPDFGECQAGTAPEDDGVACTVDVCDEGLGEVINSPDDTACDDGDPCTIDTCDAVEDCVHDLVVCPVNQVCNSDTGECESAPQTLVFQNVSGGYSGTVDTFIMQNESGDPTSTPKGDLDYVDWDTDDPYGTGDWNYGLVRFESIFASNGGPIPAGSEILSATLTYVVFDTGDDADVHDCLVPWDEATEYDDFGDGTPSSNEIGPWVDTASAGSTGTFTVDVTKSLQAWTLDPASNHGWIIVPTGTGGVDIRSSEYATASDRPKLAVTYVPGGCTEDADCDDGNFCTADNCVAEECVWTPSNEGLGCDDGNACTDNDVCDSGVCTGSGPTGNVAVTFTVHGPPMDPASSASGIYLEGTGDLGVVPLAEVGPAMWEATVELPRSSNTITYDYSYARDANGQNAEVGPWGEDAGLRSLSIECQDLELWFEDTVWNWDDQVSSDPAPPQKGPTLSVVEYDSSETATLAVEFDSQQTVTLHYSTAPFYPNPDPEAGGYVTDGTEGILSESDATRYEFTLTNLMPGWTYSYYVEYEGEGLVTSEYQWTTSSGSTPFRIVAFGDSQDTTMALHAIHRDVVDLAYSFDPDVLIRPGDQVNNADDLNQWAYFFAIERPLLGSAIYLPCVGNHEYVGDDDASNFFSFFALPEQPANEQYYAVKYNNTLFIALSTETTVTGGQENWLASTLQAASGDSEIQWKIVFFHRPAFSSGWHGSEPGVAAAWHDEFVTYGVDVVFNGHDHDFEYLVADGVNYYVIGGGGAELRDFPGGQLPETVYREKINHAVVVDVDDQQLSLVPYRIDGSVITQAALSLSAP